MTGRHVALIRGINVGTAKRVAMADLRAMVADLGYKDVSTLLNSGNVLFTASGTARKDHGKRIEKGMTAKLGVSARVTVLTGAEVANIVRANPLGMIADDPSRYQVAVLNDPADAAKLKSIARQQWHPEALAIGKRAAYLWCPDGMIKSPLAAAIAKALKDGVTTRNWATMLKLYNLVQGD